MGLQKLTLLDFPEKVACTVFIGGCNMRCPYCHNSDLIAPTDAAIMSIEEFFAFLESRKNLLGGVCITGGEPLLSANIIDFARQIKQLGYAVKLDTNGSNPSKLTQMIGEGLVDYVAMDIKNSRENYNSAAGCAVYIEKIQQSASLLLKGGVDYEFRTTVVRELHTEADIASIGEWIRGAKRYSIQNFQQSPNVMGDDLSGFTQPELEHFASIMQNYVDEVKIK